MNVERVQPLAEIHDYYIQVRGGLGGETTKLPRVKTIHASTVNAIVYIRRAQQRISIPKSVRRKSLSHLNE